MKDLKEEKLIKLVQKGNSSAYEQLIMIYEKKIYNVCLKMLGNEQEARDAFQEVCIKIWQKIDYFKGDSKFSTWIYRIATNQCLDILRKNKKKTEISIHQTGNETGEEWDLEIEDPTANIEKHVEQLELKQIIEIAMEELKPEQKQIVVLRDVQNYSYDEISEILEVTTGTVKSRLSRARKKLKEVLMQNKEPYKSFFRHKSKKEGTL